MAHSIAGGVPYTPNLVPQINLDVEIQGLKAHIRDLERFLEEELTVISTAMVTATVQAAYGSLMVREGPVADQPLDATPILIEEWDFISPLLPNRVIPSLVDSNLIAEEGGVYSVIIVVVATISAGVLYKLTMRVNGTDTGIFTAVDASQQTTVFTMVGHGILSLNPGDDIQLFGEAQDQGSPHTFIIESAVFSVVRVSERNDEPGIF